ncbi:MAG: GGDEF domain-containing protein [Lachnospiraceae bacterium]|nr:GGDEF domain-containing protein [Lachnospiraceae bacterium]
MVQLTQIITVNAAAFTLLLIVKLHMRTQMVGKGLLDSRILKIMIHLTMFQCFFDTLVFWIDGKSFTGARELNWIGNIIYYILNMTVAYFWPLFTEYKLSNNYKKVKKQAKFLIIPLALLAVLVMTAPLNGIVFTVSEENIYKRSDFFFAMPTALIFVYVIWGTWNVYLHRKKGGKYMLFPAVYFIIPVTLAMVAQMLNYGISLIFIGIAIALTGVYMSTQNESAYIDQLCGVFNRRYYNDFILSFCNANKKDEVITGALIDMDDFKGINDTYGHKEGDKALCLFGAVLRDAMNGIGFTVRYGGDEFILLTKQPPAMLEAALLKAAKEVECINASGENEFHLAFSYGIAALVPEKGSDEFLHAMDIHMYEMKRARKKESIGK